MEDGKETEKERQTDREKDQDGSRTAKFSQVKQDQIYRNNSS